MYDVVIIGAGVVGSATAYYLSQYNLSVALLEASNDVSNKTSKANSAIIHAGYDPKEGTLMARLNVKGAKLAKEICEKLDVSYKQVGALVLAFTHEDLDTINMLYKRGIKNGVEDLHILNYQETKDIEPAISDNVLGALYAGTSAIISPWEYTLAMAETAVRNGVDLKLSNKVTAISKENDIFTITTNQNTYQCRYIINAAGVDADTVHELIGKKEFTIRPSKGQYHLLDKPQGKKVKHTVFQCPSKEGKGVLVSPTVHGNLIVGPDSKGSDKNDSSTTADELSFIKKQAALSIPTIDYRDDIRNFAGVRARSDRSDFIVEESASVPGMFNLAGICSPGLSAAPAIALEAVKWILNKEHYTITKKDSYIDSRKQVKFRNLSDEERAKIVAENPAYGRIVCRCETVTEGEILDALKGPIPPCSIEGVKRRCHSSMGRCQGGFCAERVAMILMRELNLSYEQLLQNQEGTNILLNEAKGGY